MVLGIKKDPSTDLSYSSLAQDKKAWASKGLYTAKSDRFVHFGHSAVTSFTNSKPVVKAVDKFYDEGKEHLSYRVDKSSQKYSVVNSKCEKGVDIVSMKNQDTRFLKARYPYSKPLGPGSYPTKTAQEQPVGSWKDQTRTSSCFTSLPRSAPVIKSLPDPSDTLARDHKNWTKKGFHASREERFRPLSSINNQGHNVNLWNVGGLYDMSKHQRIPAFDAQYDSDGPRTKSIDRNVYENPQKYSQAFRTHQRRMAPLPTVRSGDSRLRAPQGECDEWLGPGTYDVPGPTIGGTDNSITNSAPGMFDSTFRGPPRFLARGSQSPNRDSRLTKTW
mmetsp:Transcript_20291/g.24252  ORF Transcript_20291/g.24252 Transcript_20291/m.24252 type:complete len:332 (+) Transcript_20291:195-1190(+)|eukprot:CAMPEP_0197843372 /NCGR_PEP_ID=MMETSP1438-20131217/236_1 /TAXON_ID=1461541 /ORGANISM="Pterosperma sp., Strain CCMP1384" /LENGTH=331 /DNA_ID=CAMNT_0043453473 /DNA_START=192 /DNA_END=1187 /DNA_ORIENTATION=+